MITLIDYGAGNLHSFEGALERLGLPFVRAERPEQAAPAGPLVLPGVGHFGAARACLRERGWWTELPDRVAAGRPLLGICLGLQLLTEGSEEAGEPGLGLLPGACRRLGGPGLKVPHVGWSRVSPTRTHPALPEPGNGWLYFVHSYALDPGPHTLLTATHGRTFSALEARDRVLGFQPHPEKSGAFGLDLLRTALAWTGAGRLP